MDQVNRYAASYVSYLIWSFSILYVQVMEKTLDFIEERYGSVEDYLARGGMSPDEIEQLRNVFKLSTGFEEEK